MLFVCGLFDFGFVLRETKTQLAYKQAKIERKNKTKKIKKVLGFQLKNLSLSRQEHKLFQNRYQLKQNNYIAVKVVSECLSIQGLAFFVLFSCFMINAKFTFNIVK